MEEAAGAGKDGKDGEGFWSRKIMFFFVATISFFVILIISVLICVFKQQNILQTIVN